MSDVLERLLATARERPVLTAAAVGAASLAVFLAIPVHVKRARPEQTALQARVSGEGKFVNGFDENGKPIKIFEAADKVCNLHLANIPVKYEQDLVISAGHSTLYEAILGSDKFADSRCFGSIKTQHVFKDAMKDGKPNPKPMLIQTPGEWSWITYGEARAQAKALGSCLRWKCGIKEREKVAIWAKNCAEWMLADLACHAYNWTSVSVYDTLGPIAASFICGDSGATVLVTESKTFAKIPALLKDEIYTSNPGRALKVIVVIMDPAASDVDLATKALLEKEGLTVIAFDAAVQEFLHKPEAVTPAQPEDLATIMYTSGTTGNPKGVKLTHKNLTATIAAIRMMPELDFDANDLHLCYLPLAHIFERQIQIMMLTVGASICYASNGAKGLLSDLGVVRPTLFAGVPKVYENIRDAVKRKMTGFKKTLFDKAMASKTADIETGCGYSRLWDMLIFSKTKQALGGRVRACISGGAPISKETLQFVLCALGPILQGYGATETSAASSLTYIADLSLGHVGPPMPQASIKLVDVPEMNYFSGSLEEYSRSAPGGPAIKAFESSKAKAGGEVWIRGHGVSPGYYDPSVDGLVRGLPSNGMAKKTIEDFFSDSAGVMSFKTGDIGTWTSTGCLKVVDRRKNMFKTAQGEYIPVEEVEKSYQDNCEYVDFLFLPKETKVAYIALCVIVSDSIGSVRAWAKGVPSLAGKADAEVVDSVEFRTLLFNEFKKTAKAKKMLPFLQILDPKHIHAEYQPVGYQESWVDGVLCANGHTEQLLTATFKARRTQLDQYFAKAFPRIYPDRPADHNLP